MVEQQRHAAAAHSLYDRLLAISREAHGQALHEVAYHALTGALHAAHSAHDRAGVTEVLGEARAQIGWIDAHQPAHRLSSESAGRHDHPGVYAMLGRQAEMIARMLHRDEELGA